MRSDQDHKQSDARRDVIGLCILLAIALCVGVYSIATAAIIAKDGAGFIEYAQDFEHAAVSTMLQQDQHPGYPLLILAAHKAIGLFSPDQSAFSWIYSAQSTALAFRLLALTVLYFIGKDLVGARFSFWAVLVIILLPKSAEFGVDALSDWPHSFFLAAGFFLSLRAAISGKLYLFALTGITVGLGYLIRPECAQIVVYSLLWLAFQLLTRRAPSWSKAVFAAVLLLGGFFVVVGPYMSLKAKAFPKKAISVQDIADFKAPSTAEGLVKLGGNIGDTLEWVFVPFWLIGLYKSFRKVSLYRAQQFFVIVLVVLNVLLMIWLYTEHAYMDKRHTFPLVVFTTFYIPAGLEALALWLQNIKSTSAKHQTRNGHLVSYVLWAIGFAVCVPQLVEPLHGEKLFIRQAAQWIEENTDKEDLVALSDRRMALYAQRRYIEYDEQADRKDVKYVATVLKEKNAISGDNTAPPGPVVFLLLSEDKKSRVVIYAKQH